MNTNVEQGVSSWFFFYIVCIQMDECFKPMLSFYWGNFVNVCFFVSAFWCLVNIDSKWHWRHFFSIKRKSHVKKVRFTICNNLYGVHHIIANHTSGPFVLRFSSCTSVIVQVTSVSQQCIVPGFSFLIAEEVGIPKKVRSWCTFFVNKKKLNCFRFSYNDHETTSISSMLLIYHFNHIVEQVDQICR